MRAHGVRDRGGLREGGREDVIVVERDDEALKLGEGRVERSLARAVASGKVPEADAAAARDRLTFAGSFDALADRELAIEAIVEEEHAKAALFGTARQGRRQPDAILATNTSSIPIMKLAMATSRPEQVIGIALLQPGSGAAPGRAHLVAAHQRRDA